MFCLSLLASPVVADSITISAMLSAWEANVLGSIQQGDSILKQKVM